MRNGKKIRGIVLAGVYRWSETPFEEALPRPLLPVVQSPLISYVLNWFCREGIGQVTICANSTSGDVRKCLGDGSQMGMVFDYYEDWTPRGPAGCVRDAGLYSDADLLVVADGTIIPQVDLTKLLEAHANSGATVTVVVNMDRRNGEILEEHLVPSGIYVFERRALEYIQETGYQDIKEGLIPQLHVCAQRVVTYLVEEPCLRVSDPESYLAANAWMLEQMAAQATSLIEYRRTGESRVHRTAQFAGGVSLIGPVLIGPKTMIGENVTIVGPTAIGAGCRIESNAVVCRSVIWNGCRLGRGSMLDGCIVVDDASVGVGEKCHNSVLVSRKGSGVSLLLRLISRRRKRVDRACGPDWPEGPTDVTEVGYDKPCDGTGELAVAISGLPRRK